jgi:outer membrane protein assembly factor BamB
MLSSDSYKVLWFGEPGPRVMIDRHNRPHAPLYKAGRMVIPGDGVIVCVDAYNGARLWDLDVAGASRVAVLRDAGWLAMDGENVFAAVGNHCLKVDLNSGRVAANWRTPTKSGDWGYISVDRSRVYGSEQIKGASYIGPVGYKSNSEVLIAYGGYKPVITSRSVFSLDRETGALLWRYATNSVIANPTLCRDNKSIYFYESYDSKAVAAADGRVRLTDFGRGESVCLVKLDAETGDVLWRVQKDIPFEHIIHLSYADGVLVGSGSSGSPVSYNLRAYNASDGRDKWAQDNSQKFKARRDHGEQDKHPMIIGNKVVMKYGSYDLHSGQNIGFRFKTYRCADCSASGRHVFARISGYPAVVNVDTKASHAISHTVRPGCYISTIPAGGLVMLPAFSSGCTCDYPVQTTITWQPKR